MKQSYTASRAGLRAQYREARRLWTFHSKAADTVVSLRVANAEACARDLNEAFGFNLTKRKVLDVGPGQFLVQSRYFALRNEVVAIDMEVITEKLTLRGCLEMARCNGLRRFMKTLVRKLAGIDRAYERALRRKLGVSLLPAIALHRGDACHMGFSDESFDMVYSRSLLHHVATPAEALSEIARVLKPGGVAYVDLHLYSSVNGSLDSQISSAGGVEFCWPHLRPGVRVVEGAFLNRLRLSEWRHLFAGLWPGSVLTTVETRDPAVRQQADRLLAQGKLAGYSKEELLTTTVVVMWQKESTRGTPALTEKASASEPL